MLCPIDQEELNPLPRVTGMAGTCEVCGGLWLSPEAQASLKGKLPKGMSASEPDRPLPCARCETPMDRLDFDGLELDRCSVCWGVWFDSGELEELKRVKAQRDASPGPAERPAPEESSEGISLGDVAVAADIAIDVADLAVSILSIFD